MNTQPISDALQEAYGSGWAFGEVQAQAQLGGSFNANFWDDWQPGNEGAAALVDPSGGLQSLLDRSGITIDDLINTTYDRIGTALAISISQGLPVSETAKAINERLRDPARAMVIARTETCRAVVESSVSEYRDAGVTQVEWLGGDPCTEICEQNVGVIVTLGEDFPSGDEYPPAHPNCVCDVAPVVD